MLTAATALILQLCFASFVSCNTEIVNFSAEEVASFDLPFTKSWPTLHPGSSVLTWNASLADSSPPTDICSDLHHWNPNRLSSCPHEYWVVLDLDTPEWQKYHKFTARISWPAYYPTDISITVFDPDSLTSSIRQSQYKQTYRTRRKYARIQAVYTGVPTPGNAEAFKSNSYHNVPMSLKLEPLYFGVLPESVIPILCAIAAVVALGYPIANRLSMLLESLAQDIRQTEREQKPKSTKYD